MGSPPHTFPIARPGTIRLALDGRVRVWDPARPGTTLDLGKHHGRVGAMGVLPDGRVVTGGDGLMRVWDPALPESPLATTATPPITTLAVGSGCLIGGGKNGITVWRI